MNKTIGNTDYEFNVKLGTTIKIKKAFGKSFNQVLNDLEKFDVEDLIKLLYCGIDESITKEDFKNAILENCGLMEVYELVESFIKQIQYPGLTDEEIEKKVMEKNQKAQAMQNMISLRK